MIMPFIRLVAIYVIVIVAVIAVFKRDQIMELAGVSFGSPKADQVDPTEAAAATPPASAPATAPAATPAPTAAPVQAITASAPQPPKAPADTQATTTAATEPEIKRPTPTPALIAASQPAPANAAPLSDNDLQTRLTEARQAYWSGNLARSEALFAALAQDDPSNPDVTGELGNILYAQRRYDEAADAYFVTGKLLVGNANPAQILPIIGVLQSIAPQKAETLRALATN